ncbi:MAG: four helix bundle protein [Oscillospiraceae bacterium]|jgi:hypothetical protein|nr:four helix bundle protein [Oscillospiraceae bacterium]
MTGQQSELTVVTKAKELCAYVMTVTQKSPKHFRFTFVTRLQNTTLDIIQSIYRANAVMLNGERDHCAKRLDFQHQALTDLKLLSYFAMLSMEQGCILPKQFEQIARLTTDCQRLTGAWINSDKRRIPATG